MKKLITIFTFVFILVASTSFVFAQDPNFRKNVILPSDETVNHDYLAAGNNVEIAGTVNGDVLAAGGQVTISGKVNGDVLAAGGQVNISGEVSQDVRAIGGQLTVSGKIGRNLTLAGGSLDLNEKAQLVGTLIVAGGNLNINAPVNGDVKIAGGNLVLNNKINGDLDAAVGNVRLTSKAVVNGNLNYWSDENASIDSNAKVIGSTTKHDPVSHPEFEIKGLSGIFAGIGNALRLMSIVSTIVLAFIFIYLFPGFSKRSSEIIKAKPWQALGWGLLLLIVIPIVSLILLLTVVGIPLSLLLLSLYIIGIFLSRLVLIYWLGNEALSRAGQAQSNVWAIIVGIIIYYLLTFLPIIGGWVTFAAVLFGFGTAFIAIRNQDTTSLATTKRKK